MLAGVDDVLVRSGADPGAVGLLIHGTTLATNAIIERKGALTALVTTEGFRDVLDIGYESRYDQYDIMLEKPPALVPRERRLVVPERVDVNGRVLKPLDEAAVEAVAGDLARLGVESVGIGFIHSYANPAHERRAHEILAAALPKVSITLSSEACPEVREYERFCTTAANAYVQPLMASYLGRLRDRLAARGLACPVLLMTSGGGLASLDTAIRFPIRLVESGPAGGAILATRIAAGNGARQGHLLRHGRNHRQDLPHQRLHAADRARVRGGPPGALHEGQRNPAAHPGHRDGGDRGGRRLHRQDRRHGPDRGGPGQRGGRSRSRRLRARRRGPHDHRCRHRARAHRSEPVRGREDCARCRCGPAGQSRATSEHR